MLWRDTTASSKGGLRKRARNTALTLTPFGYANSTIVPSRNSYKLRNNSLCVSKPNGNTYHKGRINSLCPSPYTSLSMDIPVTTPVKRSSKRIQKPSISPNNKILKYLKARIAPMKIVPARRSRHSSNKRNIINVWDNDSRFMFMSLNKTSSKLKNPVIHKKRTHFTRKFFKENKLGSQLGQPVRAPPLHLVL